MSRKNSIFREVPVDKAKRNLFDLSHDVKMSGKFGYLYPVLVQEMLPGDTAHLQTTTFIRFAPMLAPVMHKFYCKLETFFVPARLLCDSWQDFITGGEDGLDTTVLPFITPAGIEADMTVAGMLQGTLWDYMGLPPVGPAVAGPYSTEQISALPFRAYWKIWNDWYRDPNLDQEIPLNEGTLGDVSNTASVLLAAIAKRGWEKDYFTAALPWAQRGQEVLMPLAGSGTVTYTDVGTVVDNTGTPVSNTDELLGTSGTGSPAGQLYGKSQAFAELGERNLHNIDAVQITTSGVSINDLRLALAMQKWMEINARGGPRYPEQIFAHFGITVPDFRMQRSELLSRAYQNVTISEVLSTTDTASVPVGDMAGHGMSAGKSMRAMYRCPEHGFFMTMMSVSIKSSYSQGVDRMWTRTSRFHYAFPSLARLGEQEILSKELFYDFQAAGDAANNTLFGYIPRYSEYKFKNDRIAGDFRTTLGFWHEGRYFVARPSLDSLFTTLWENATGSEETFRRIFAVTTDTDYLWMQLFHRFTVKRPLPYFGVPSLIG